MFINRDDEEMSVEFEEEEAFKEIKKKGNAKNNLK